MQGGQGPGRGIYIARRIAVVLIVLLLLILLVPRACDALLGTREEQSSEAPETADVEEEETSEATREVEGVGAANIQLEAPPVGPPIGLGGIPGGGAAVSVPQAVPPVTGTGVPEPIPPPPAPPEPVPVGEPPVPAPIAPVQEPIFVEEPVFPGEPFFFGEPFFGEPLFFAEPVVFEQPTPPVQEPPESRTAAGGGVGATAQAGNASAIS